MDDTARQEGRKAETYDYLSDFQILPLKEKRGILKNAKHLLKLQKEDAVILADTGSCEKMEIV